MYSKRNMVGLYNRSGWIRGKYMRRMKKRYSEINADRFYKITLRKLSNSRKTLLISVQLKNMIEFALRHKIIRNRPPEILLDKVMKPKMSGKMKSKELSKLRQVLYEGE